MDTLISPLTRKALSVGQAHLWAFQFIGRGDAPTKPMYRNGWWFETVAKAPVKAIERINALEMDGIRVTAIIVAHEAPKLLSDTNVSTTKPDFKINSILPKIGKAVAMGFLVLGAAALSVAIVPVAVVTLLILFVPLGIDPAVVVRLEDGSMIVVTSWSEV